MSTQDQKLGQIYEPPNADGINAELDFIHTRLNGLKAPTADFGELFLQLPGAGARGSTNSAVRVFKTIISNTSSDVEYRVNPVLGDSFVILNKGIYQIDYSDAFSAAKDLGISVNSSQLTTSIFSINAVNRLAISRAPVADVPGFVSRIASLNAKDTIRAHITSGAGSSANTAYTWFVIRKLIALS